MRDTARMLAPQTCLKRTSGGDNHKLRGRLLKRDRDGFNCDFSPENQELDKIINNSGRIWTVGGLESTFSIFSGTNFRFFTDADQQKYPCHNGHGGADCIEQIIHLMLLDLLVLRNGWKMFIKHRVQA